MTGLEAVDADVKYTFNLLVTHVLGKTCLACIDKRWVDISLFRWELCGSLSVHLIFLLILRFEHYLW